MLEHTNYLETVALRVHHDAVQTFSANLAGTNTTKILNILEGTFGLDLQKDDENDVEVESVSEEKEHPPQTGMTSCAAAQSADSAKFSTPAQSPSTTHKWPATKIKGSSKQCKDKGPEAEWEFEVNH